MGGGMYGWGMREGAFWTSTMGCVCVIGLCGAVQGAVVSRTVDWQCEARGVRRCVDPASGMTPG